MNAKSLVTLVAAPLILLSCGYEKSSTTGWNYNDPSNGGFQKVPFEEQETGPNLVLVEGGTFTMGRVEQDFMYDWNNVPRRVTVSSYYLDQTEISNINWGEYLYWVKRVYGVDYPELYKKALPDTLVWREKLSYNEPYVDYYLRHPAYRDYPVVGINWLQANDYCSWRTDRVNEYILIREGILDHYIDQIGEDNFNTDAYLSNQYNSGKRIEGLPDLNPNSSGYRNVRMEDGILLPKYRLPTEAEWEFAAFGLIGNSVGERVVERRLYPWNGHAVRNPDEAYIGMMLANFKRGRGDNMGVAGKLNDNADITAPVFSYWPNDYGLYNMAGNVSEWVMDVYRPLSMDDVQDFRPFRGNVYKTKERDNEGLLLDKYDIPMYDINGLIAYLEEFYSAAESTMNEEETTLMATLQEQIGRAKELLDDDQEYEANIIIVEESIEEIKAADEMAKIAPVLLKDYSTYIMSRPGELRYRNTKVEENIDRRNYKRADNINYLDGDYKSHLDEIHWSSYEEEGERAESSHMYVYPGQGESNDYSSLINDHARVYKGASWNDRAYWMVPGTRRFLDERQSSAMIGFRCAMDRVGSPVGLGAAR
ncbi:SUMF1/EgtB/PvdO family nonheme iron enzyme [Salibacteraceae bacterium]|nr:SUMF1/EgtB/PvdO family nonheme iron enzyme [Salibacteraceae bacterium]